VVLRNDYLPKRTIQTRLDNIEVKVPKLVIALASNLTVIDAIVLETHQKH